MASGGGSAIDPPGYDAGKKIKGKKRHVLVDTEGLLLHALLHAGDVQDRDGGVWVMATLFGLHPFLLRLYADGGYQGPASQRSAMMASALRSLLLLVLMAGCAAADTLALPDKLIDLRSDQGEALLIETKPLDGYLPISAAFETQKNQAFCGVVSMVMVLNAIKAPAPTSPEYQPYSFFTQENVLDDATEAVLPRAVLMRQGMTLDQLGQLLKIHPIDVAVHHADAGGLDAFRSAARDALATKDHFVIVNYLRRAIGQERGGHISPLAAYDAKADRFLILDVARYKYPPVWVTAADLFDAMNTTDSDNENRTRGFVIVSKSTANR